MDVWTGQVDWSAQDLKPRTSVEAVQWSRFSKSLVCLVDEAFAKADDVTQELDALFNQDAVLKNVVHCQLDVNVEARQGIVGAGVECCFDTSDVCQQMRKLMKCPRSRVIFNSLTVVLSWVCFVRGEVVSLSLSGRCCTEIGMCDQICVFEVPKNSTQESVEAIKITDVSRERICERMCEQIGVVEVLQISSQDSVEALEIVRAGANFWDDVWTDRG